MTNLILEPVTTKYIINEEKRTVVCIITTVDEIPRKLKKYGFEVEEDASSREDIRSYKGIAKCSPDDEWDEVYGRQLAEYRAARARRMDVNAELNVFIKSARKRLDNLSNHGLLKRPYPPKER